VNAVDTSLNRYEERTPTREALAADATLDDAHWASVCPRAAASHARRGCSRAAVAWKVPALAAVPGLRAGDLEAGFERFVQDGEGLDVVVEQRLDAWSRVTPSAVPGVEVLLRDTIFTPLEDEGVWLHDPRGAVVGDPDQLASRPGLHDRIPQARRVEGQLGLAADRVGANSSVMPLRKVSTAESKIIRLAAGTRTLCRQPRAVSGRSSVRGRG